MAQTRTTTPAKQAIRLPNFLPTPGEQLQKLLPPNHDSLSSILGLSLAYLKHMHPAKLVQPDESMRATAHIINLLLHEPLVQSLLPKGNPANTAPVKELNSLQIRLVMGTGNPRVILTVPVPIPGKTPTLPRGRGFLRVCRIGTRTHTRRNPYPLPRVGVSRGLQKLYPYPDPRKPLPMARG